MLQPLAVAASLGIPAFAIFDSDGEKPDKNGSREKHRKDNTAILKLCGVEAPDPFPSTTLWGSGVITWPSEIGQVVEEEIGKDEWSRCQSEADAKYGYAGNLHKNILHIACSLEAAWQAGKRSASLQKACESIMKFAEANG